MFIHVLGLCDRGFICVYVHLFIRLSVYQSVLAQLPRCIVSGARPLHYRGPAPGVLHPLTHMVDAVLPPDPETNLVSISVIAIVLINISVFISVGGVGGYGVCGALPTSDYPPPHHYYQHKYHYCYCY